MTGIRDLKAERLTPTADRLADLRRFIQDSEREDASV